MTALTLARLPVAAGGAVLESTGNLIHWGVGRFMRAPLANSAVLAMVTFTAMAGSNALYMQDQAHPAPLFAPVTARSAAKAPEIAPIPAERPKRTLVTLDPLPVRETTGSVKPAATIKPLGNAEVIEIQRKLHAMQIFDGAIDGLYGPKTARAIRTFEERVGIKPRGELTPQLLEAVRKAPVILAEPKTETVPVISQPILEPAAAVEMALPLDAADPVPTATRAVTVEPLPAPAPLQTVIAAPVGEAPAPQATGSVADTTREPVLQRELPETPQEAMNIAVETAGEAIDTIIAGVQTIAMTTRPEPRQRPVPAQQFAAVEERGAIVPATPAKAEPAYEVASIAEPRVGATLVLPEQQQTVEADVAILDTDAKPEDLMPAFSVTDPVIVAKVQRGLASLGFLHGPADGIAGEATAKAIRNFEVYFNYRVTGRISPELLDLLGQNGAAF